MAEILTATIERRETFTWTKADGRSWTFDVTRLREWVERERPPLQVEFGPAYREDLRVANDVDVAKALALPAVALRRRPIIAVIGDRKGAIVIDGSHRLWRLLGDGSVAPVHVVMWDELVERFQLSAELLANTVARHAAAVNDAGAYDPDAHLRRSLDHFAAKGERP